MTELDAIWNRARADLVITTESGDQDVFLWERSARIARSAQAVAKFPEVSSHRPDEIAIVAAALYHDAGWIAQLEDGEIARTDVLVRPPGETHRDQSAMLMDRGLAGIIPRDSRTRASEVIRTLHDRDMKLIEAHVVADCENLEEFCLLALWPTVRRGAREGKGVQAAIDTWKRKKEYQFWTARLNESFRFDGVREIARARLAKYERVMTELEECHHGTDIAVSQEDRQAIPSGKPMAIKGGL